MTVTPSSSATETPTATVSASASVTITSSASDTASVTPSLSQSVTSTVSITASDTASWSTSLSPSDSCTPTASVSHSCSLSVTASPSVTFSSTFKVTHAMTVNHTRASTRALSTFVWPLACTPMSPELENCTVNMQELPALLQSALHANTITVDELSIPFPYTAELWEHTLQTRHRLRSLTARQALSSLPPSSISKYNLIGTNVLTPLSMQYQAPVSHPRDLLAQRPEFMFVGGDGTVSTHCELCMEAEMSQHVSPCYFLELHVQERFCIIFQNVYQLTKHENCILHGRTACLQSHSQAPPCRFRLHLQQVTRLQTQASLHFLV